MKLWQYNRVTGYWNLVRSCDPQDAHEWLRIFQEDEPTVLFKLAHRRPR